MRAAASASAGPAPVALSAPSPNGIPAATAYGEHLRLVVGCALAARPELFSADERALARALMGATTTALDVLCRLCARVRQAMPIAAGADLARDAPAGWTLECATEIALTPAAAALARAALAVAFADPGADLTLFPRLALGRHPLPSASPCAQALAAWAVGGVEAAARPRGRAAAPRPRSPRARPSTPGSTPATRAPRSRRPRWRPPRWRRWRRARGRHGRCSAASSTRAKPGSRP